MPKYYLSKTSYNFFDPPYTFSAPNFGWHGSWDWVMAGDVYNGDPISGAWGGLLLSKNTGGFIDHQTGGATSADPAPPTAPGRSVGLIRCATLPLPAQVLIGQVDLRIAVYNWYGDPSLGPRLNAPGGPYLYSRLFIWVSVGETDVVRTVLLDYAEEVGSGSPWPTQDQDPNGPAAVIGLAAPQSISGTVLAGDRILMEFGNVLRNTAVDQGDIGECYLGTYDNDGNAVFPPIYNTAPDAVTGETGFEFQHGYSTYKVDNRAGYLLLPAAGDAVTESPAEEGCLCPILP